VIKGDLAFHYIDLVAHRVPPSSAANKIILPYRREISMGRKATVILIHMALNFVWPGVTTERITMGCRQWYKDPSDYR
jgi:hypothetical protein